MDTKDIIRLESQKIGIDILGFTSCVPFIEMADILEKREKSGFLSGFEEKSIEKRLNPSLIMEDCSTIISAAISYNIKESNVKQKDEYRYKTIMSRCSWGIDYHKVLKSKLEQLADFMKHCIKCKAQVFVDTNPLIEREIARRAGIGFVGKNCSIINPVYGSYIFLGEILTDISLEPDAPLKNECGDCDLCIKACPGKALLEPYTLNAGKCVSYITQSRNIRAESYKAIGSSLYGCDMCQNVCPKNRNAESSTHEEFYPDEWNSYPDAVDVLHMDNRLFSNTFKNTSSGWRGKKTLQRNAIIVMGNSGNRELAVYIIEALSDVRNEIRSTAVHALYNLLGNDCFDILKEHLKSEVDENIRNEINNLLQNSNT